MFFERRGNKKREAQSASHFYFQFCSSTYFWNSISIVAIAKTCTKYKAMSSVPVIYPPLQNVNEQLTRLNFVLAKVPLFKQKNLFSQSAEKRIFLKIYAAARYYCEGHFLVNIIYVFTNKSIVFVNIFYIFENQPTIETQIFTYDLFFLLPPLVF